MGVQDKAGKTDGKIANPRDCNSKRVCPCDEFDQCRKRRPYGSDVWSDKKDKEKAMGLIAFDGDNGITDDEMLDILCQRFIKQNERRKKINLKVNDFFGNVRSKTGSYKKALVLPQINDAYITSQMDQLGSSLYNTAVFTDFQRSMIVRANLVKNGLTIWSDEDEDAQNKSIKLIPYVKGKTADMWSVDHIKVKVRGGCNRFCNAAVMQKGENSRKGPRGCGCPCIIAVKKGDEQPVSDEFKPDTNEELAETTYKRYECVVYFRKKKEEGGTDGVPGTCHANRLCNLDDPREHKEVLSQSVTRPV